MLFMQFALLLDFLEEYKKYFQPEITYRVLIIVSIKQIIIKFIFKFRMIPQNLYQINLLRWIICKYLDITIHIKISSQEILFSA